MTDNSLFYLVFLAQMALISVYFPIRIIRRVKTVLEKYPPTDYPKLYVRSVEVYEFGLTIYKYLNLTILMVGFILIIGIGYWDTTSDEEIEGGFSLLYFILQMSPLAVMEISEFFYFKQMRKADKRKIRIAESQPRQLFDFVSTRLVSVAIIMNIGCVLFIFYLDNFEFSLTGDTFIILITLVASNSLFAIIIRFNMTGSKLDPYQDTKDRLKQTQNVVRSLVIISIIASTFIILQNGMDKLGLDFLEAASISLYLQLIAWLSIGQRLNSMGLEDINFEVYKKELPGSYS